MIEFINGLFGADHPPGSSVEYPNTESVSRKLRKLMSDMIVIIGGTSVYHIEAEIKNDENIVLRAFEYGFAEALRTKSTSDAEHGGHKISLKFPNSVIIYWETTERAPDEVILSLEFPDGGHYDYKVKTFKFLNYGINELEERKLTVLLPFCVLKLRKRAVSAKRRGRSEELSKLSGEMRAILDEVMNVSERVANTGHISESDARIVIECTEMLYRELYGEYDEFKEADVMLKDKILTYSEEAELRGMEKGMKQGMEKGMEKMARNLLLRGVAPDLVAESSGLPLDNIRSLMN